MPFKRISNWLKKPFFRRPKKPQKIIKFSEVGLILGKRVWPVVILFIFIVIFAELLMIAEGVAVYDARYVWGAAALTGFLFSILTVWLLPEKFSLFNKLYLPGWAADISFGVLAGFIAFALKLLLNRLFLYAAPQMYVGMFFSNWLYEGRYILIAIAGAGLLRPLGEELLFRRYFLEHFNSKYSAVIAILLTSALYGLRTLDPFRFFMNFGIGIILAWVALNKNLRTAIFANITCNLIMIIATLINISQMKAGL